MWEVPPNSPSSTARRIDSSAQCPVMSIKVVRPRVRSASSVRPTASTTASFGMVTLLAPSASVTVSVSPLTVAAPSEEKALPAKIV